MNADRHFNEVTSLEYSLLKVPYELLNKKFRATQKIIEKNNFRVKEAATPLEHELKSNNGPIPVTQVSFSLNGRFQFI